MQQATVRCALCVRARALNFAEAGDARYLFSLPREAGPCVLPVAYSRAYNVLLYPACVYIESFTVQCVCFVVVVVVPSQNADTCRSSSDDDDDDDATAAVDGAAPRRWSPDAGWVDRTAMDRGPRGYLLCRFCNEETPSARRTFCSNGCVHEHRVRVRIIFPILQYTWYT